MCNAPERLPTGSPYMLASLPSEKIPSVGEVEEHFHAARRQTRVETIFVSVANAELRVHLALGDAVLESCTFDGLVLPIEALGVFRHGEFSEWHQRLFLRRTEALGDVALRDVVEEDVVAMLDRSDVASAAPRR